MTRLGRALLLLPLAGCLARYVYQRLEPDPLGATPVPKGLASLHASACGECHAEVYAEWRGSKKAEGFTCEVWLADWEHHDRFFWCLRCHAPLPEQQPDIVTGLDGLVPPHGRVAGPNPSFDAELQAEGVTCVACHLRGDRLVGPHAIVAAPHEVFEDEALRTPATCDRCHQLPIPPFTSMKRPPADTLAEHARWQAATGDERTCVSCHMPAVERASVEGRRARDGRRHTFPGAWDDELVASAIELGEPGRDEEGAWVEVRNLAGHNAPTAEPSRAFVLRLTLLDAAGGEIAAAEEVISRRIDPTVFKELWDTSLLPDETRRVRFALPAASVAAAAGARVKLAFHRLEYLPEVAEESGVPEERLRVTVAERDVRWP